MDVNFDPLPVLSTLEHLLVALSALQIGYLDDNKTVGGNDYNLCIDKSITW
jgi:hypothetical protein